MILSAMKIIVTLEMNKRPSGAHYCCEVRYTALVLRSAKVDRGTFDTQNACYVATIDMCMKYKLISCKLH